MVEGANAPAAHVPRRWRNLAAITGVEVVDTAEAGLVNILFPAIAASLRLDSGHLGLLSAAAKLVSAPFGPAWVWLAGRIGRKAALIATTVTGGIFGMLAGFSDSFLSLLVFNTLMSACLIGGQPISNAIIADLFDDKTRGIASGYFYAAIVAVSSLLGPLLALLTGREHGWRYGMWTIGAICIVAALAIMAFYRDPGIGASEPQLTGVSERTRTRPVTIGGVLLLFRIPSYSIMMLSRLLSGHLLITIFGVQFLVSERGFTNAAAAIVLVPFGIGYVGGTIGGGFAVAWLDRVWEDTGRIVFIQIAQVGFAIVAFFGTQFTYAGIAVYGLFWGLFGLFQGMNPPVNRPIVMSVVLPELRGQAFAIFLTIFQTIGWAMFALTAGWLATRLGLEGVFLWILVVLMLVNGLALAALHVTYPRDARRVTRELERRRAAAQGCG
ncbi:MAG TPA: MFS transporter [Propylenella sp.]|nr:MFS transporter [Propylenella sp.]